MELSWIVIVTLKLTKANIIRIKDAFMKIATANPELSAVVFLIVMIAAVILILKFTRSG